MNLLEHHGKRLLADAGIATPSGAVVEDPEAAAATARSLGRRVVVKSQVPAGKRGKSGGIAFADTPDRAREAARRLLGRSVGGFAVGRVLVEECVEIERELYAAVLNDPASKAPLVLFSTEGGMDIEKVGAATPERVLRTTVDIRTGFGGMAARSLLEGADLPACAVSAVGRTLTALYTLYRDIDAELVEINPLVLTAEKRVVALDSKISLDPGALARHPQLVDDLGASRFETGTELERQARRLGVQFVEFDGDVGILANGAGLTMTTLDAVHHYGGRPANFLEIGGDAYTKGADALRLVLSNPRVRSLLVNFCGAFARTDVMAEGVVAALEELRPGIPVVFTIHGTGEHEAVSLVRSRLGIEPYEAMDDAVKAAVAAATEEVAG